MVPAVKRGDATQEVVDDGPTAGLGGFADGIGGPGAGGEEVGMRRPEPRKVIPGGDGGGASAEFLSAEELACAEQAQR